MLTPYTPTPYGPTTPTGDLPECTGVPSAVIDLLKRNSEEGQRAQGQRAHLLSQGNAPEKVLFCSPPDPTTNYIYFRPFIGIGIGNFLVGIFLVIAMGQISLAPFALIFFGMGLFPILLAFYYSVRFRHGYRVVTNYRAALVVTEKYYGIFGPSVTSFNFRHNLDFFAKRGLRTGLYKMTRSVTQYDVGDVTFGQKVIFYNVSLPEIEKILGNVAQQLVGSSPKYEVKAVTEANRGMKNIGFLFGIVFPITFILTLVGIWGFFVYQGIQQHQIWQNSFLGLMLMTSGIFSCAVILQIGKKLQADYDAAEQGRSFDFCKPTGSTTRA